jgi:hypothetical protein
MSLEAALAANTEALTVHTAALNSHAALLQEANAGREAAVASLTGAVTEGKHKGRTPGSKAAEKAAAAAPAAPAPAEAVEEVVTADVLRAKAGAFLNVAEPEKAERKTFVKSINAHFGAETIVTIPAENFAQVVGWFDRFAAGEKVNFSEGEDEVEGEDDGIG